MSAMLEALKELKNQDINESERAYYNYNGSNYGVEYTLMYDFRFSDYKGYFSGRTTRNKLFKTPEEAKNFFIGELKNNFKKYASIASGYFADGKSWRGENFEYFIEVQNPEITKYTADTFQHDKEALDYGADIQKVIDKVETEYVDKMVERNSYPW